MSSILEDALYSATQSADWPKVELVAREWLSRERFFFPHLFLINALIKMERLAEADIEFDDLISYKFNLADRLDQFPIIRERYRARLDNHYILSTMAQHISFEASIPHGIAHWNLQHKTVTREQFIDEARDFLKTALNAEQPSDRKTATIFTFGSCFAANLARVMINQGMAATNLLFEESINSTYANRVLMEIVAGYAGGQAHEDMRKEFDETFFESVRTKIRNATHVVLTVGVAPSFFYVDNGTFVFAKNYAELLSTGKIRMRMTTYDENIENLRHIIVLMNEISPTARKIITVSPVPLAATAEQRSAVIADCVSKSTLRTAVNELVTADKNLVYFPAFEIVRWLSVYTSAEVYGADDESSRHVSNWVVEFIVGSFIAHFFTPT